MAAAVVDVLGEQRFAEARVSGDERGQRGARAVVHRQRARWRGAWWMRCGASVLDQGFTTPMRS
jgi:hypothetical protein